MSKFEALAKMLGIAVEDAAKLPAHVVETLEKVKTPEIAVALKGAEREKYLQALDHVYGDTATRSKSMGFGDKTWYHGTTVPIDEFQKDALGASTNAASAKKGFFFARDPSTASDYAELANRSGVMRDGDKITTKYKTDKVTPQEMAEMKLPDLVSEAQDLQSKIARQQQLNENTQKVLEMRTKSLKNPPEGLTVQDVQESINDLKAKLSMGENNINDWTQKTAQTHDQIKSIRDISGSTGQNVVPVRLKGDASNIHVKDYKGADYRDSTYSDEMTKAQADGKTGVLFKNTYDPADQANRVKQNIAAVFEPNQVRSEYAAFDPRFKDSAKLLAGAAAMPAAGMTSPLDAIKSGVDWYHNNISEPLKNTLVKATDLTKDGAMANDPTYNMMAGVGTNPTSYATGPIGALVGGIEAGADMVPKAPVAPGQPAYAEGGEVLPDGFQIQDQAPQMAAGASMAAPQGGMSGDLPEGFELQDDKYGSTGQMIKTGLEGAAEGLVGPLAPLIEKHVLGVNEADIRGRQETNPITHGIGQAAGLTGGLLTGTGEAAVMTKAGDLAMHAVPALAEGMQGLEAARATLALAEKAGVGVAEAKAALKAADGATGLGYKVGSAIVQQAAEMGVLSGSDEVSKMILNDPDQTAETALTNIGLSAALGGATGGLLEGTVAPLWKATAGPKVEAFLSGLTNHLNGTGAVLPEVVDKAIVDLGIPVAPEIRAALSNDPKVKEAFVKLKYAQNDKIMTHIEDFHKEVSEGVMRSLGVTAEDLASSSDNEAGHALFDTFQKEYKAKFGDIGEKFEARNAEAAKIGLTDESKLGAYDKLMAHAVMEVGTDSPYYNLYKNYSERLLAKDTIGGIDGLRTELNNDIRAARAAVDYNKANALTEIRTQLGDFQESQILKMSNDIEKDGAEYAGALGRDLVRERSVLNDQYRRFAQMSGELSDHLGTGQFYGKATLERKLGESLTPEQLMKKFSIKNNADFIPFLQQNFPETYANVQQNELKAFLKPAIMGAKDGTPVNVKKLNDIIEKAMYDKKEYVQSILPPGSIDKVKAGQTLATALPNPKDSGTPGGLMKLLEHVPSSTIGAMGAMFGHSVTGGVGGFLLGEMSSLLSKDAPEAMRLAYLKFMGSDQPIKAEGFKAMVDFFHNTYKGENLLSKATTNVFKAGAQVLGTNLIPDDRDRTKLDKAVERLQKNPNQMFEAANKDDLGHYLPNHQTAMATASARALQYLQTLKPQGHRPTPLDREIPPSKVEIARYNRALDIAQQPAIVLQHIKEGTLQGTDIQDLHNLYPGVYKSLATKLTNEMTSAASKEEPIPYKTRMGISLFLGQPMDSSMLPSSIMAAQPHAQAQQGGQQQGGHKGSTKSLGKSNSNYQTPLQSSEADKGNRRG